MKVKRLLSTIFFLFGLFSCTTNKVAGRDSFNVISVEEEIQMGEKAYRKILSEEKLSKNHSDIARLHKVSTRLVTVVGPDMPKAQWEFNVIESDKINAFALPGGKVAIYSALLHILNDDELAYVIGHEIAHVTIRHGTERMSQQLALQLGSQVVSVLLKDKPEKTKNVFFAAYGVGSQVGITLPYSRKNELEADKHGTIYAARAGYNPQAAITTLQKFQKLSGDGSLKPEFLSTHPVDATRIQALEKNMSIFVKEYKNSNFR